MASTSSYVSQLNNVVSSLQSGVQTQAQKVDAALVKIDNTVNNVAKKIENLRRTIIEGEEKQIAHENVLKIEQQINEQLRDYLVVRKSVLGVIKDFDINLARDKTINELSEEVWMSSSRYWLSYAFIAVSAWIQDSKEVCMNAVSEALRRDPTKTALFFCLLNMRFSRHTEAREWLYEYFGAVDSAHPPRETALLIQAYLYGVFGHDSQLDAFVQNTVERWINELNTDTLISSELVENYGKYVNNLPTGKSGFSSDVLDENCANIKDMEASLLAAGRYKAALQRVDQLDKVGEVNADSNFIKSIDKLLDDLVSNYDDEELRLQNEKKLYELIMQHEGNVEAAKKEFAAYTQTVKEAPNIGQQMFLWAVYPNGVDVTIQKFAMQKTKGWYMDALKAYDHNLKSTAPGAYKLQVGLWADTTDGKDREAIKKNLHDKYMSERSRLVVFTKTNIILSVLAIALLIVGCVIGFIANEQSWSMYCYIAGCGLFAVFAVIVFLTTFMKIKKYPERIAKAQSRLDACLDAIDTYRKKFEEACAVKDDVLKKLEYI